jgi:hypothetical protein
MVCDKLEAFANQILLKMRDRLKKGVYGTFSNFTWDGRREMKKAGNTEQGKARHTIEYQFFRFLSGR